MLLFFVGESSRSARSACIQIIACSSSSVLYTPKRRFVRTLRRCISDFLAWYSTDMVTVIDKYNNSASSITDWITRVKRSYFKIYASKAIRDECFLWKTSRESIWIRNCRAAIALVLRIMTYCEASFPRAVLRNDSVYLTWTVARTVHGLVLDTVSLYRSFNGTQTLNHVVQLHCTTTCRNVETRYRFNSRQNKYQRKRY